MKNPAKAGFGFHQCWMKNTIALPLPLVILSPRTNETVHVVFQRNGLYHYWFKIRYLNTCNYFQ